MEKSFDRLSPSIIRSLIKGGGTVGQVLVKNSGGQYDFSWQNPGGIQSGFQGQAYAVWSGVGLIFNVYWPIFYLNGRSWPSGSGTVTLDAADLTFNRLDVIAVTAAGPIAITGIPSADPIKATIDSLTQLEVTTILVASGATEPTAITDEDIYKENVEWLGSSDVIGADFANATDPFSGTKCVDIGAFSNGQYLRFIDNASPILHDASEYALIKFYVKLKATFDATAGFIVTFKNGASVVSSSVTVTQGLFNFDRTNISAYQLIVVPLSAFSFTSALFDTVNIELKGANGSGFKLDNLVIQAGISPSNSIQNGITTIETNLGSVVIDRPNDAIRIVGGGGTIVSAVGKTITITAVASPAGLDTQIQYNDGGSLAGDSGLIYNKTDKVLGIESIDFALTPTALDSERRLAYSDDEGALSYTLKGGNITTPINGALLALVNNGEATTLNKGEVVYAFGAQGQRVQVKRASNTTESTSSKTFGIVAESIASGAEGFVMVHGIVKGIDTSAYAEGDSLYLSTSGGFTKTKPSAPNHLVYVGFVVKVNASSGEVFAKIQNGYEIDELHDVAISGLADGDLLAYENSTSLWKNKTKSALGIGSVTSVAALTIGTTGTDLSSTVANSTTTPVITLNVPTASATNRGALSSSDWTTFNNKQDTISLTTTGNSGASTFIANTLNIPNYTLAGLGGFANPMTTLGDIIYGGTSGAATRLGGSAGFLKSTGAAAPTWSLVSVSDISATGTPSATTYLRGDGTWSTPAGGGSSIYSNETAPSTPTETDLWWKPSTDVLSISALYATTSTVSYTETSRGSSINQTGWTNPNNSFDGGTATFASWASNVALATNTIYIEGYGFDTSLPPTASITSITVTVKNYVSATNRMLAPQVNLYNGATALASQQTLTLSATSTNSQTVTFTGIALSDIRDSNFRVEFVARHYNGTISGTQFLDYIDVTVDYDVVTSTETQFWSRLLGTDKDGDVALSGSFTATSLVKSGGTASEILAADGSVITAGSGITISGGVISSSGGGGGITSLNGLTASTQTFANDTNVTITSATSTHTLGWSGQLSVGRGGSGAATLTGVLIGNGTSAFTGVAGTANQLLRRNAGNTAYEFFTPSYLTGNETITLSGDVSGSGSTAITTTIGSNKVTLAMMAQVATATILGRVTASTGNVEALTGTQATTLLDTFTSSLKGLVPPSGGGTTNFLRADGTWASASTSGMSNPMTTLGDIIYGGTSGTPTRLAGSAGFLKSTGAAAPTWATIAGSDVTGAALTKTDDTNVTLTLGGTPATSLLRAASLTLGWTGTLAVSRGGTGAGTLTGVVIGNGTSAMTAVAGTANQLLRRNAGNTAYEFFTPTYLTANQTITLTGAVTGSGSTSITTTLANSIVGIANLSATGTPSASTYLRGDNTWAAISGASPGGINTEIQLNSSGSFGGANLFYTATDTWRFGASGSVTLNISGVANPTLELTGNSSSSQHIIRGSSQSGLSGTVTNVRPMTISSSNITSASGTASAGDFTIKSGDGLGGNVSTGNLVLSTGTPSGTGARGGVFVYGVSVNTIVQSATTNSVISSLNLIATSSGTPAIGIGTALSFHTQTAVGNNEIGSTIESVSTNVTSATEAFDLVFKTMLGGAAATEKVRITSGGNVGIGTTSPALLLEVRGNDNVARFRGSSTQFIDIIATSGGAVTLDMNNGTAFALSVNTVERLRIDTAGNVGIGTTSPLAKLDSNGKSLFRDFIYNYQVAPTTKSTTATLSGAELLTGILTTTGTSYTVTVPTGTNIDAAVISGLPNDSSFDWYVVNTASGTITIGANGNTTSGSLTIATGTSAHFRFRKTASNTYTIYRI